jgi:hypothetical protein
MGAIQGPNSGHSRSCRRTQAHRAGSHLLAGRHDGRWAFLMWRPVHRVGHLVVCLARFCRCCRPVLRSQASTSGAVVRARGCTPKRRRQPGAFSSHRRLMGGRRRATTNTRHPTRLRSRGEWNDSLALAALPPFVNHREENQRKQRGRQHSAHQWCRDSFHDVATQPLAGHDR